MDESGKNAASFQLVVDEAEYGNDEGAKIHERRPPCRWFLISAEASHFEIMSRMEKTLSSQQATDWREGRRLRAWELKQEGCKQLDIESALWA
jgi:hypothetical protein